MSEFYNAAQKLSGRIHGGSQHWLGLQLEPILKAHADEIDRLTTAVENAYNTGVADARAESHRPLLMALKRRSEQNFGEPQPFVQGTRAILSPELVREFEGSVLLPLGFAKVVKWDDPDADPLGDLKKASK